MRVSTPPLGGEAVVCPGQPVGQNLRLQRPAWVQTLTQGRPANEVPGLLAAVFNLCGQSHSLCSRLALSTAGALPQPDAETLSQALRRETASEHLRRMAIDWPRLLAPAGTQAGDNPAMLAQEQVGRLTASPILARTPTLTPDDWQAQCDWLQTQVLGVPATAWWQAWKQSPLGWLQHWTQHTPAWLPQLLRHAARPAPVWTLRSDPAHTGCWSRQADGPLPAFSEWSMLGARVADLVALCLDDGTPRTGPRRLRWGTHIACASAQAQDDHPVAVAWVEMARGLLVHRASVIAAGDAGPARVRSYQVQAPTDTNLHPHGPVAHALAAIDMDTADEPRLAQVNRLMAAFDPCVPFGVVHHLQEHAHA